MRRHAYGTTLSSTADLNLWGVRPRWLSDPHRAPLHELGAGPGPRSGAAADVAQPTLSGQVPRFLPLGLFREIGLQVFDLKAPER